MPSVCRRDPPVWIDAEFAMCVVGLWSVNVVRDEAGLMVAWLSDPQPHSAEIVTVVTQIFSEIRTCGG
ncbi:MAG: hypothetical protein NVSMB42_00990 [Herpetosiphon sp.]